MCRELAPKTHNQSSSAGPPGIARWFTPAGINISKEGIKPEFEVKLTDEDINNSKDPQLERAIELAKQAK